MVVETLPANISSFGLDKLQLLESVVGVDFPKPHLAACAACDSPCACDILNAVNANSLSDSPAIDISPLERYNQESIPIQRDSFLSPLANGEQHVPYDNPMAGNEPISVEQPRTTEAPPAREGSHPESPLSSHLLNGSPSVEEAEADTGAAAADPNGNPEPFPLGVGRGKEMGTAGICEGIPTLSFSEKETEFLAGKIGLAIVGKFSHSLPSSHQIQRALGKMELAGSFSWKFMNAEHILLQFQDMNDYTRMLNGPNGNPVWFIDIHPMRVFKWTPDFDTFFESPIAAVWCNLIGIPIHLYDHSALFAIGRLLGKPLQADHATIKQTRLSFPRICVEIDISIAPPEEVILNILGKDTRYKVVWDRIPIFCVNCKHVGHVKDKCYAAGRKYRTDRHDPSHAAEPPQPDHVPKFTRQEWRPKISKGANTTSKPNQEAAKEDVGNWKRAEKTYAEATKAVPKPIARQAHIDADGFQLVSRRQRGRSSEAPLVGQRDTHMPQHIDKLHMRSNVATVSFGCGSTAESEPGGCAMVVSCGTTTHVPNG